MSDSIKLPTGLTTIELPGGGSFGIDLIDVCKAIDKISVECEGKANYEYLDLFIAWVSEATNGAVTLNSAQADWLIDNVRLERARQKKAVVATLNLLNSMGSTPSPSPPPSV